MKDRHGREDQMQCLPGAKGRTGLRGWIETTLVRLHGFAVSARPVAAFRERGNRVGGLWNSTADFFNMGIRLGDEQCFSSSTSK
jgi:hypothetical protein